MKSCRVEWSQGQNSFLRALGAKWVLIKDYKSNSTIGKRV